PKEEVQRKVLDDSEFDRLIATKIDDIDLDFYRDMFLFALYANGMRVSDLLLLRWNTINTDIHDIRLMDEVDRPEVAPEIKYRMFKRDKEMPVPFTFYTCKALFRITGEYEIFGEYLYKNIYD